MNATGRLLPAGLSGETATMQACFSVTRNALWMTNERLRPGQKVTVVEE